jgi:hypothetical protein
MNNNEMAAFAVNVINLLHGPELDAIDSNVRAALVAAFGSLPAVLIAQTADAVVAEDERKAKISSRNATTAAIALLLGQTRDLLKAHFAPKMQFDLAGFDYPSTTITRYVAQDPTDLSVIGFSNGVNKGKFVGKNKSDRVVYDIWRRTGHDGT